MIGVRLQINLPGTLLRFGRLKDRKWTAGAMDTSPWMQYSHSPSSVDWETLLADLLSMVVAAAVALLVWWSNSHMSMLQKFVDRNPGHERAESMRREITNDAIWREIGWFTWLSHQFHEKGFLFWLRWFLPGATKFLVMEARL
jgi:hypothetical protein